MNNEPFSKRALDMSLAEIREELAYFTEEKPPDEAFIRGLRLKRTMLESAKARIECKAMPPFVGGEDFVDFLDDVSAVAWADMPRHD